jgi:hypothetical protein
MGFEESDVQLKKSKSGKSIVMYLDDVMYLIPVKAVNRVLMDGSNCEFFLRRYSRSNELCKSDISMIRDDECGEVVISDSKDLVYCVPIHMLNRLLDGDVYRVWLREFVPDE